MCGSPDVSTHISSPGWAQESWNHVCLPLQASLAPHLRVGGGQRAQAAAADNTPGRAGKWQGKGRLLISLQHGLSPGALGCLSPWLPPSRCLGYHPLQAAEGRLMCGMGCGRAVLHWAVAAWNVPGGQHCPWVGLLNGGCPIHPRHGTQSGCAQTGELCGFPLGAWTASVQIRGLRVCWEEPTDLPSLLFCSTSMLLCAGSAHSQLVVAVAGWRCWQPCWQVWVGRGRGPHRGAVGDLPRADGLSTSLAETLLQQCSGLQLLS